MPKPLTHADRRTLGHRARKQLARSAHAAFASDACPSDPLALLRESMEGRLAALVPLKYERMAASPFGFFRGAVPIMAADLATHPNTGLITQICGDAHVSNLGAFSSPDGHLAFDINDFDETLRAPFEWDVKRLATSLLLAGREAGLRRGPRREAVEVFTARYRRSMHEFSTLPVIELARFQIRRLAHIDPMPAILRQAERSTPQRLLARLTEPAAPSAGSSPRHAREGKPPRPHGGEPIGPAGRRFRSDPPTLRPLPAGEAERILSSLHDYVLTLQPERRHFLAQYTPVDVAFKVVGTGSVALRDYVVYFESPSRPDGSDPLFLQIKEEPASAYAPFLPDGDTHTHQGRRVVNGARAMQLTSDPFLGYTTLDGRDFLVRQLNDHKASLDLATLTAPSLHGYADLCGELLARGHARAGDPVTLAAYLGNSDRFDTAILAFARAYADKTERDWNGLRKSLRTGAPPAPTSTGARSSRRSHRR
jgi:uncharacterized protein (DUF2252 family)